MEPEYWLTRWREGRIGFHEREANAFLERHAAHLGEGTRVFVPLCGKSVDLELLAWRGHDVIGIDLADEAVRAFFAERGIVPKEERRGPFTRLEAHSVVLLAGDFFALREEHLDRANAFYDRAALVALPEATRARYVARLRALLPAGARGLVVAFAYDQSRIEGPPFSVDERELRELYAGATVELLESRAGEGGKFKDAGIEVRESVFAVTL